MLISRRSSMLWGLRVVAAVLIAGTAAVGVAVTPVILPTEELVIETRDGEHTFQVEIADEPGERTIGLMHRKEMAPDAGMLFVWDRLAGIAMWMKNTHIPLDMLFISKRGVITRIAENTEPMSLERVPSGGPILAVLELNGGTAQRLGIGVGDRVRHRVFAPKPQ